MATRGQGPKCSSHAFSDLLNTVSHASHKCLLPSMFWTIEPIERKAIRQDYVKQKSELASNFEKNTSDLKKHMENLKKKKEESNIWKPNPTGMFSYTQHKRHINKTTNLCRSMSEEVSPQHSLLLGPPLGSKTRVSFQRQKLFGNPSSWEQWASLEGNFWQPLSITQSVTKSQRGLWFRL